MSDTYGLTSFEPLASYDHDSHSWKMYAVISLWGLTESLETLPKSGMTRSGRLFQQPVLAPLIDATELSVWPTPTTQEVEHPKATWVKEGQKLRRIGKGIRGHSMGLADSVRMWPTPTAVTRPMEGNVRMYRAKVQAGDMTEAEAEAILGKSVWEAQGKLPMMWPTPTVDDANNVNPKPNRFKGLVAVVNQYPTPIANGMAGGSGAFNKAQSLEDSGQITKEERIAIQAGNGGKLNPIWVEWLMGFPLGWTDLEDSETQSSHKSPNMSDD